MNPDGKNNSKHIRAKNELKHQSTKGGKRYGYVHQGTVGLSESS
jgi:hypothetical protein